MIPNEVLVSMGANVPFMVHKGKVYRLFTATLLHAGLIHIALNTASLINFCITVERLFSIKVYGTVFFVGGIQGIY
jgi:rhomboid protease GluP